MSCNLLQLACIQNHVPEFILKLYSILEKNELDSIIGWGPTGTEIVIKDVRRLERSVLPHFFRHNKLESFVRQLNMYNFRKLNKFSKMRNRELYFQNEHFRQGNIESLVFIRRKKKGAVQEKSDSDSPDERGFELQRYRKFVKSNVGMIREEVDKLARDHPESLPQLKRIFELSSILIGGTLQKSCEPVRPDHSFQQGLLMNTVKEFRHMATMRHLMSTCSIVIDEDIGLAEC